MRDRGQDALLLVDDDNRPLNGTEYMEHSFGLIKGQGKTIEGKNNMVLEMRELYPNRILFELTPPLKERDQYKDLPKMEFSALLPEY